MKYLWQAKAYMKLVAWGTYNILKIVGAPAKSEIGFRRWTPGSNPSPHPRQQIRATYLQSSTMLRSVQ